MLDFLHDRSASAFQINDRAVAAASTVNVDAAVRQSGGTGGSLKLADLGAFVNNHYGNFNPGETNLWARLSPAIANVVKVYARLLRGAPLTLVKPDGEVLRWPPKDGRQASSKAYQILRLWEEEPNEIHSPAQIRGMMAEEWIYEGDVIIPQHRHANDVVRRMFVLPTTAVSVHTPQDAFGSFIGKNIEYSYFGQRKIYNPKKPQFMHLRNNIDAYWPLRGRPSFYDMPNEVAANAIASIYRKEVFRQGGPVRMTLEADPESDVAQSGQIQQIQRIADRVAQNLKRMQSWMDDIAAVPPGFKIGEYGPKSADEMYVNASRMTDEKLSAVHGVPLMYQGNMEKSNYTNSRQQVAILVKDSGAAFFSEIEQWIEKAQLRPLGGEEARMRAKFDTDHLMRFDVAIWNKLVLDRLSAGLISPNEARLHLDYMPLEGEKHDKPRDPMKNAPQQKAPAGDAKGVAKPAADK